LFYDHGISTLVQPLVGFDLLDRGQEYLELAIQRSLAMLAGHTYLAWYRAAHIRVYFYGAWRQALASLGYQDIATQLDSVMRATEHHTARQLIIGLFADRPLDDIVALANKCQTGSELIERYYGLGLPPVDLVIGSGQPALWDLPLLDINRASLYFLTAPTFFTTREMVRRILYDHLFERVADDSIKSLPEENQVLLSHDVLGTGHRTPLGWMPDIFALKART
jgi:hypothetical protein